MCFYFSLSHLGDETGESPNEISASVQASEKHPNLQVTNQIVEISVNSF
jgi:hypothetical protein